LYSTVVVVVVVLVVVEEEEEEEEEINSLTQGMAPQKPSGESSIPLTFFPAMNLLTMLSFVSQGPLAGSTWLRRW
jgi:hypothetical protein